MTEINDGNRTLFLHDLVEFINVQAFRFIVHLRCKRRSVRLRERTLACGNIHGGI